MWSLAASPPARVADIALLQLALAGIRCRTRCSRQSDRQFLQRLVPCLQWAVLAWSSDLMRLQSSVWHADQFPQAAVARFWETCTQVLACALRVLPLQCRPA